MNPEKFKRDPHIEIDPERRHERLTEKPRFPEVIGFYFHEGFWYPKRTGEVRTHMYRLRNYEIEYQRKFKNLDDVFEHMQDLIDASSKPLECECGFTTNDLDAFEKHENSKKCLRKKAVLEAKRNGEFIPEVKKGGILWVL